MLIKNVGGQRESAMIKKDLSKRFGVETRALLLAIAWVIGPFGGWRWYVSNHGGWSAWRVIVAVLLAGVGLALLIRLFLITAAYDRLAAERRLEKDD